MCLTSQMRIIYDPHVQAHIHNSLQNMPLPEHCLVTPKFFCTKLWVMTYVKGQGQKVLSCRHKQNTSY